MMPVIHCCEMYFPASSMRPDISRRWDMHPWHTVDVHLAGRQAGDQHLPPSQNWCVVWWEVTLNLVQFCKPANQARPKSTTRPAMSPGTTHILSCWKLSKSLIFEAALVWGEQTLANLSWIFPEYCAPTWKVVPTPGKVLAETVGNIKLTYISTDVQTAVWISTTTDQWPPDIHKHI